MTTQPDGTTNSIFQVNLVGKTHIIFTELRHALLNCELYSEMVDNSDQTIISHNPALISTSWGMSSSVLAELIEQLGFKSAYYNYNDGTQYVVAQDNSVHICNNYLIDYLLYTGFKSMDELRDLTYKVADNPSQFAIKYDKGLIPNSFYSYLGQSVKIINESGWNIYDVRQKIFIAPVVYELRGNMSKYYTRSIHKGETISFDKIRRGENLDSALIRILSQEFKIADDYVGAFVERDLEFDRDKEGIIIPRLRVYTFVDSINDMDWKIRRKFFHQQKFNIRCYDRDGRSWIDMEKAKRDYLI